MMPTIGSVPFLNAKPLIKAFEHQGDDSPVHVVCDVPAKLPQMLDAGLASAVMASSFDALRTPGRRVAAGVSISSRGPAESVRLFSKVDPTEIRTLALDASSLTSNNLARVILAERRGVKPVAVTLPPDRDSMLRNCDAAVLIGDKGLAAAEDGLLVLDLGSEWTALTGLPFVWALWIGKEGLDRSLACDLAEARDWGLANLPLVVEEAASETGFSVETCRHYLAEIMDYDLTGEHLAGYRRYGELLVSNGLLEQAHTPTIVEG
jgi:chorismate dehydratase